MDIYFDSISGGCFDQALTIVGTLSRSSDVMKHNTPQMKSPHVQGLEAQQIDHQSIMKKVSKTRSNFGSMLDGIKADDESFSVPRIYQYRYEFRDRFFSRL